MTISTSSHSPRLTLVLGASGKTGRRVVDRLTDAGYPVRAASRSGAWPFDWNDQTTWAPALEGVGAVYITYYPDLALPGAAETVRAFADLAVKSGAKRLVLLSGRGEAGARQAERHVERSGADWTLVRCAFFNQNFDETFAEPIRHGVLAMPAGDTAEPFLDAEDIADVVFAALTDDRHIGQLYELTGPRLLTLADVTRELSDAIGREVRYLPVTVEQYAAELSRHGMPKEEAEPIAQLIAEVLDGRNAHLSNGVQRALGRPPRDFADYARKAAAAGAWNLGGGSELESSPDPVAQVA
ncbi:MAG: NAD(P)H-binding protein [Acidobacteriota bacterium]